MVAEAERLRVLERESLQTKIDKLKVEKEIADLHQREAALAGDERKAAYYSNDLRLKTLEIEQKTVELQREQIQNEFKLTGALTDAQRILLQQLDTEEQLLETRVESARAIEASEAQAKNLIKALTGVGEQWKETLVGSFVLASQTAGGLEEKMLRMKEQMKETFSVANILGSTLQRVAQSTLALAKEQDTAVAEFNKATSTMGEYTGQLIALERANVHLGISTQDSAKAFGSLLTGVTDFAHAGAPVPAQLAETAAMMSKLGVSTDLTAQTMENSMRVMGMTAEQSMELTNELASMAIQMRLPIEQVTESFNAAMPVLAKFGTDAPAIFKKVQVASRSLGVAVSDLLGIMGQFDTFSGAAEAAGKLNAILGGGLLNSTDLLMASEDERLRMVREAISASGQQYESMDKFTKMSIANTLGIQDISTATKMLSGDMDKFGDALDASGLTKEETEERIRATQSITEKLANTWRIFAISMRPVVDVLHSFADGMFELNKMTGGAMVPIVTLTAGLLSIAKAFGITRLSALLTTKAFAPLLAIAAGFTIGKWLGTFLDLNPGTIKAIGAALIVAAAGVAALAVAGTGGAAGYSIAAGLAAVGIGALSTTAIAGDATAELPGFQDGGPVKAGRPIVVGEGGSEVFVPGSDGAIRRNEDFVKMPTAQATQAAPTATAPAAATRDMTVVIQLDKRELGRATIKAIEDVPGYNIRGALGFA
jgi:hypothetical protein